MGWTRVTLATLGFFLGCAPTSPPPVAPQQPIAAAPAPVAACAPSPAQPEILEGDRLTERSKALFDALDGNDVATFLKMVGPSFVSFEQGRSYTAAVLVQRMSARVERNLPRRTRTWKDERVYLGQNVAIFVGDAVEVWPGEGGKTTEFQGWNTVVWAFDGSDWKAAHWQWQVSGVEAERSMWNEAYRMAIGFSSAPNRLLVETVKGKKAGAALDVAMGQGRNAVFLASKGWKVTGVDISDEGIRQAKDAATKNRTRINAVQADIEKYDLGTNQWDLVTLIYAGNDASLIERIKPSMKKNGLIVVEFFHTESSVAGAGGFATGELAAKFEGWKVLRDEIVEDIADWGMRKQKLVRFVAQKP